MTLALFVGVLVAGGVYLVLQRGMVRITFGFVLLGHAANLVLLSAGVASRREAPLVQLTDLAGAADALPQAFALTAIVIAFSITIYMLTLAGAGSGDDDTDDPPIPADKPKPPGAEETVTETDAGSTEKIQRGDVPSASPKGEGMRTSDVHGEGNP
ncbi:sodium:proton antiporter [Hoyosella subflava]|uniref:NADH-ubiquinone oxidoreductase chain 4L n=1 Tax=Hoyosella subflava (strain DSM 45089 / JCM 17490 / NBRC 109087 / DQS3-9A1) TaxID=443218 RepID=F6EFB1_HOYSD|nr:cation:proton antiporter subunit C [Hoyosella subflava]AEF38690.1 NADH-ubiquinone oxidoreductase chain 4L [Hoyosella subflava DQS3-9A1]